MTDTEYRRLIQAAKDKAMSGFLVAAQRALQEVDQTLVDRMAGARSGLDQSELVALRYFLRQEGNVFLRRIDLTYRSYLERALQTMYTDLRPGMRTLSANEWSLIDDEAVNQQIEVGRLAQRMRESNEESIGRLNVIVANLHGKSEARERENPFRPYLPARALFESIRESTGDESTVKALFELLADALIPHLGGFYTAVREVFEAAGVRGKYIAQRSRVAHNQRYFGAPPDGPPGVASAGARINPDLTRLLEVLQRAPAAPGGAGEGREPASIQDFVRSMFSSAHSGRVPQQAANPLVAQLDQFQKKAAVEDVAEPEPELAEGAIQLRAFRGTLDMDKSSVMERMTVDVIAMLFEIMLGDEQVPAPLREQIARLQIPTLKAALLEPALMNDERHPARRLLNRLSSAAVGADPATPAGQALAGEMERIGRRILAEFKSDTALFTKCLHEFENFLSDALCEDDSLTSRAIEAVEAAETYSVLLTNTTSALCETLLPLNLDKNISDFLIAVWPHVLVRAAWQDVEKAQGLFDQYHALLPELIWSVQDVKSAQERSDLIRMLPNLVRRLRAGLELVQTPEDESKAMLDMLVGVHTRILRGGGKGGSRALPALNALRQEFARMAIRWGRVPWTLDAPPQARESVIEEAFGRAGVAAELHLEGVSASAADRDFLARTYVQGTRVEMRASGSGECPALLVWVSTHRSLYLFRCDADAGLILYTAHALLEALAEQAVVPLEYAPVFERAVESLLFSVDNMEPAQTGSAPT